MTFLFVVQWILTLAVCITVGVTFYALTKGDAPIAGLIVVAGSLSFIFGYIVWHAVLWLWAYKLYALGLGTVWFFVRVYVRPKLG